METERWQAVRDLASLRNDLSDGLVKSGHSPDPEKLGTDIDRLRTDGPYMPPARREVLEQDLREQGWNGEAHG